MVRTSAEIDPKSSQSGVGQEPCNGDQNDNGADASGAAYVFVRNGTTWSQQAYVKASNTSTADWFGYSVAASGDTIVIGAPLEDSSATGINGVQNDNSAGDSGAVYVFVRSGTSWGQQAYVKASNTDAADRFGNSVAVFGDMVVIGAPKEDSGAIGVNGDQGDNSAVNAGAAFLLVRNGTSWSQQAYVKASNTDAGDWFGGSVAASEEMIVIGARDEDSIAAGVNGNQDDNSKPSAGAVYVFELSESTGVAFCFGDGLGTPCPCNNDNDGSVAGGQAGCANGSFTSGAVLFATGTQSLGAADLVLTAEGTVPSEPGLFFQGDNAVNGGTGIVFGDGLRCAGGAVVRLGVRFSDGSGHCDSSGIDIGLKGGIVPGDTLRYQYWYRDPVGTPCGNQFNLTNGIGVTWEP